MQSGNRSLSVCLGVALLSAVAIAADPPQPKPADVPAMQFGYDVPGQIHNDPSLFVRSIVRSERKELNSRDGVPENELAYHVCNIEPGDKSAKRESARLYFHWPDAGLRVALQREIPFERCVMLVRNITGEVKQIPTSDILYTYRLTAIPANNIWTMSWSPPWTKPSKYVSHGIAIYEDFVKGMKNPQEVYSITTTRKQPADTGAYQALRWRRGTQLYLALPRFSPTQASQYRAVLSSYEARGVLYSIRPAQALAQEFEQDSWVLQSFQGRDVLKVEVLADKEKDNEPNSIQPTLPVSSVDLVQLSSVVRDRSTGRAMYQATYIVTGN